MSIFWAESLMLQGFEACGMVRVVHGKSVIFAVIGFEAFFCFCLLTSRSLKRYIEDRFTKQYLENQIQQGFQRSAVANQLNPY